MKAACANIVPYNCVYIDAEQRNFLTAAMECLICHHDRLHIEADLQEKWTTPLNTNPVLPLLSVRTGLDLYLRVMNFPEGSEIIVSAITIPSIIQILHYHNLRVVPLDVCVSSMTPKTELLSSLTSKRTVAILVAHIFGRLFDVTPFVEFAACHDLIVIEDCAEAFCGFDRIGEPASDISFFSFGPIKYCTAFGGAIAKVKNADVYERMRAFHASYPMQSSGAYLKKVLKYFFVYQITSHPRIVKPSVLLSQLLGIKHQEIVLGMLRGFSGDLMQIIRLQPCTPLLSTMLQRFQAYPPSFMEKANSHAEYVVQRLPVGVTCVGVEALVRNHWLFPVIVEKPDVFVRCLIARGVDAYRGVTQLNVVESDYPGRAHLLPTEARYLIDHVVYLPVSAKVPYPQLDRICLALRQASDVMRSTQMKSLSKL